MCMFHFLLVFLYQIMIRQFFFFFLNNCNIGSQQFPTAVCVEFPCLIPSTWTNTGFSQSLGNMVPLCTILRFPQQQQPLQQAGQEVYALVCGRGAGQRSDGRARGQRGRNGGTRGFHDGAPVECKPSRDCVCARARVMEGHLFHVYSHVCTLNHLYAENMMVRLHILFSILFSRIQRRLQFKLCVFVFLHD